MGRAITNDREHDGLLTSQRTEAVERLALGLAHDLNNYLAAIHGHAERVRCRNGTESPDARSMDAVMRLVARSADLVSRLPIFARRCIGGSLVVSLNVLVEELAGMVGPLLGERVRLETHLESGLWPVDVDRVQIEQAVLNLLVNARDAMPDGGCVTICTRNLPGSGADRIRLSVSDTGPGIPEGMIERVFEPFVTTKKDTGPNGLGLSVVYDVVTSAGGVVEIDSPPGAGTTFHLVLPRADSVSEESVLSGSVLTRES